MHHTINERGGGLEMEKSLKDMTRILLFLAVANLPFITIVQVTGLDIFLDSFENPSYYLYLEYNNSIGNMETKHSYIIVQKSSHPDFSIKKGDILLYQQYINGKDETGGYRIYCEYYADYTEHIEGIPNTLFHSKLNVSRTNRDSRVIGKIVGIAEYDPWHGIAIKAWDISINNLNIGTIFLKNIHI